MSLGVFLRACDRVWAGRPLPQASRYCTSHFQLRHREDGGNWSEPSRWWWAGFQLLHSCGLGGEGGGTGSFLKLSCWLRSTPPAGTMQGELQLYSSMSLLFSLEAKSCATETFCSSALDPCTHWFQKGEVVGRRREDCTKQINNVMSPGHRNSILAALLLL